MHEIGTHVIKIQIQPCDNFVKERSPVKKPVNTTVATSSSSGPLLIHYGDIELLISIQLVNLTSLFQVRGFPDVCLILRCMHVSIQSVETTVLYIARILIICSDEVSVLLEYFPTDLYVL